MLVPASYSELTIAKAWGKSPDEWEAISDGGQALMTAYERVSSRLLAVQMKLAEKRPLP